MRFSIVIPVYNVADYLQLCIDSVLANDCRDCEIVLVDDGSTDGLCPAICDENAARHPKLIRVIHQENQGLGGARNTGMEAARGDYLFFLDSDDTIAPNALEILSAAIEKNSADVYSFPMYSHDGQGHRTLIQTSEVYEEPFSLSQRPEFLFALPAAWARLWRREFLLSSDVRFPSRVWYEDIRTTTKLFALAKSIVTLPEPLYYYLARPGSIMRSGSVARNREILEAFDDILAWFRAKNLLPLYQEPLCRLAVDHILLAATVRVARVQPASPLLAEFSAYMEEHFPNYAKNPYLSQLPSLHKLLLFLIRRKQYRLVALLFRLKGGD